MPTFKDDAGNFDQLRYQQFADSLKGNREFSAADANRVLRDDTRLAALSRLLAGPGYVLNGDVAEQLKRVDTTWNITVASIDYASYSPTVAVTDAALQKFYDDNSFRYDIPARARLQLVEFKATEFIPTSNPSEHDARAYYNANAARFPAPTDASANAPSFALGESATAVTDNFPKVRLQVEAAMKEDISRRAASRAANDFTIALFERKVAANSSELGAFISASRRSAVNLAPFTFDAPPADRAWLANYAEQINRLNANRYFSDPLPTPEGFVVMLWQETVPAYKPMLSEARARVAADFTESEKRRQFTEHGKALRERLLANVKSGKSFAEAAAAAKLEVKSYAEFTLREPPQDLPYAAFGALQTLQAGELSEMVSTGEKGQFTFVVAKKLPDTSTSSARFAEVRKQLMQYTAAANESAILAALVEDELKRSQPDTP
ncbi:MAG: peptidyl-prolyl cis-trans isomerase [Candidatus Didemnitutus sp.]|nr:peptidyl-prolyl cis-trans isomerase [Candidatus Didemnitutus sp.]